MFVDLVRKRFHPVSGGYHYYPSLREGARLVTEEEYQHVLAASRRAAAPARLLLAFCGVLVFAVVMAIIRPHLGWSQFSGSLLAGALSALLVVYLYLPMAAPYRLLRRRPAITGPRPFWPAYRQQLGSLPWWMVALWLVLGADALRRAAAMPRPDIWWLAAGLLMLGMALAVGGLKLRMARENLAE